ncbi:uncharacterized protein LOC133794337 [Humulus lupulus]|uniref:uncharacterized protein LOC133794337 n=1 Tax=Humulus lupulus TaxID=3486 RepID=UPI002B40C0D3|nr:uncharacterized protein LOC133794337 [Humulus lupulus]
MCVRAVKVTEVKQELIYKMSSSGEHSISVQAVNGPYSHFISLPLAIHRELVDKLNKFQDSILESDDPLSDMRIDKSIFTKPESLHLTVLMLKLWNEDLVAKAEKVLQNVSSKVMETLQNRPVSIRLQGLDIMRGSWDKAQVVYAPVEEIGSEGRLLRACHVIIDAFVEAGLVLDKDPKDRLKLHATVMNTIYRKWGQFNYFDGQSIFKQFGSEEWGEYVIREAHLSQRGKFDDNGYFHCCTSMPFPENVHVD